MRQAADEHPSAITHSELFRSVTKCLDSTSTARKAYPAPDNNHRMQYVKYYKPLIGIRYSKQFLCGFGAYLNEF